MLEMLLPEYTRQLMENYQSVFSQLASQLRWLYFDDASRLVTRVGWLDDGWIRVRLDGHWEFTGELLRELSWVFYNVVESNSLLPGLTASDYDIISLDLSTARTDELVASNVIFLKVLESTPSTAQYTLKLFSTTKKAITQDIAPPGTVIERLRRASVYVSNPAQPNTRLDLFVFMG
ncbi:MAG: hypothetical protein LM558_02575 [Thermosphaera sp.]|nr:hypothetical protein [Thermosphaera sp.]